MITVSASDYRRNFSMSRYRRNFETEVVASLEIWRAVVTVLIPLVLSTASKFITDSYEQAFWLNVFMSVLTLGVTPVLLACGAAKRLVILVMHLTVTRGYEKQLKAFLLEVHCSLEPTLLGTWGRNFKLRGFTDQSHRSMDRFYAKVAAAQRATAEPQSGACSPTQPLFWLPFYSHYKSWRLHR